MATSYRKSEIPDHLQQYFCPVEIGLEPTPDEYVAALVAVFREVRRVLRDDGTVWLNLGDSYAAQRGGTYQPAETLAGGTNGYTDDGDRVNRGRHDGYNPTRNAGAIGLKHKDLIGIPWRVAFALQADGWYLRSDIIWSKPNPMPESVTDRPTKAHEFIFLLTKNARYYYDAAAIAEPAAWERWGDQTVIKPQQGAASWISNGAKTDLQERTTRNKRSVWQIATQPYAEAHFATFPEALVEPCVLAGTSERGACPSCGAPWRRVVEREADERQPYKTVGMGEYANGAGRNDGKGLNKVLREDGRGGDLATTRKTTLGWEPSCTCDAGGNQFEPDDFEIINTPTGERVGDDPSLLTGRAGMNRPRGDNEGQRPITRYEQRRYAEQLRLSPHRGDMQSEAGSAYDHYIRTDRSGARPVPDPLLSSWIERGWIDPVEIPERRPYDPVPQTVLDPFCGSGTTGVVALRYGRSFVGIDLNPEYVELARRRITNDAPLFNRVEVAP